MILLPLLFKNINISSLQIQCERYQRILAVQLEAGHYTGFIVYPCQGKFQFYNSLSDDKHVTRTFAMWS
jgi:hypothetical protein